MDAPTLISTPKPKAREGAWLWMLKIFAGLLIVVLLGIHFVVNHLVAPGGLLTYADVVRYYSNPIIPVMEVIFLGVVIAHALVGLRSILLDLNPAERLLRWLDWALIVVGSGAFLYGLWLVIAIVNQ